MQAEIIAIGDEILIGQTVDTNSTFIASQLSALGVKIIQKKVVSDQAIAIVSALDAIDAATNLVFITGGLGPTKDDITKETLNDYFGGTLEYHPQVFEHITSLFKTFGKVPNASNKQQAYLPSVCQPIMNEMGTACGMHFTKGEVHYFSLPGVPYETQHLVADKIVPWINANLKAGTVVHKMLITQGVSESELAETMEEWENALPAYLHLAYLPSPGIVKLRLSSYDGVPADRTVEIAQQFEQLKNILGDVVFGGKGDALPEVVGELLIKQKATLSIAESCTGGCISHLLTSVAGSSAYFLGSAVTYANAVKTELLKVRSESIAKEGVVSKKVAEEMALGAQAKFKSTYAIATTGVAGPSGGTKEKPVGTVWIATAGPDGVRAKKYLFGKNRERNIQKAALMALDLLRKDLQNFKN